MMKDRAEPNDRMMGQRFFAPGFGNDAGVGPDNCRLKKTPIPGEVRRDGPEGLNCVEGLLSLKERHGFIN